MHGTQRTQGMIFADVGRKRAGRVVGGVQQPARYPTGSVAMAEIIKYRCDGGYLIPEAL